MNAHRCYLNQMTVLRKNESSQIVYIGSDNDKPPTNFFRSRSRSNKMKKKKT